MATTDSNAPACARQPVPGRVEAPTQGVGRRSARAAPAATARTHKQPACARYPPNAALEGGIGST
eukprot:3246605-Alexandrium_andersonii.AAC.1